MTRDFANLASIQDDLPQEGLSGKSNTPMISRMLLVLALIVVVAVAFAGGYYLGQQHGISQQKVAEQLQLQQQVKLQNKEINHLKQELAAKPKETNKASVVTEVGELTFYDDLINDKVDPNDNNTANKASKKVEQNVADIIAQSQQSSATNLPIYIQLGSFANQSIAKGIKQQVVALGMISFIQSVTLSGNRHHFRVLVGPYRDMRHAVTAKTKLHHKLHIDGMITRPHKP